MAATRSWPEIQTSVSVYQSRVKFDLSYSSLHFFFNLNALCYQMCLACCFRTLQLKLKLNNTANTNLLVNLYWFSVQFQCLLTVCSLRSVHLCVCRCGVCWSYPPLPSEYLFALYKRQEECAMWEAAGHEHQGGAGDPGLCQEEWRLPHGGADEADQKDKHYPFHSHIFFLHSSPQSKQVHYTLYTLSIRNLFSCDFFLFIQLCLSKCSEVFGKVELNVFGVCLVQMQQYNFFMRLTHWAETAVGSSYQWLAAISHIFIRECKRSSFIYYSFDVFKLKI